MMMGKVVMAWMLLWEAGVAWEKLEVISTGKGIDKADVQVVPEIINSRTMLPIRFISENLGSTIVWDGIKKTVTITY